MSDPSFYSMKEVLAQIEQRMTQRLDRIESKLDHKADEIDLVALMARIGKMEATALDADDAAALRKIDLQRLSKRVDEIAEKALTIDNVKETIGEVLRESEARGWTTRERVMGLILFATTVASFVLNLVQSG